MSIGKRIKERRKMLNISRADLAHKIGVSVSAISNYENELSTPTIDNVCHLIKALSCDANYLFQDEMAYLNEDISNTLTIEEIDGIKKYRTLSEYGKKAVKNTIENEYERDHANDSGINLDIKADEKSGQKIYFK